MRTAPVLVALLAACSDPEDEGLDASSAPLLCAPGIASNLADGDGTPPTGEHPIMWECVSGCTEPVPVLLLADTVTFAPAGTLTDVLWTRDGGAVADARVSERDGCWYKPATPDGCVSDFFICDDGGRPFVSRLVWRDAETGGEQILRMR